MSEAQVVDLGRQALQIALLVAMPMLVVSLLAGIVVSVFQVVTSIQDATLTFVPKIIAVALVLFVTGHWILRLLMGFATQILSRLPGLVG